MRQPLSRLFNVFSELTIFISVALSKDQNTLSKDQNIGSTHGGVKPEKRYLYSFENSVNMLLVRSHRGKFLVAAARFGQVIAAGEEGFDVSRRLT
jgi:hypothetical protein